jgi:hypothetical protein
MPLTATRAISIGLDLSDDELVSNIAEFSLSCLTHGRYVSVACAPEDRLSLTSCAPPLLLFRFAAERMFGHYERHIAPYGRLVVWRS